MPAGGLTSAAVFALAAVALTWLALADLRHLRLPWIGLGLLAVAALATLLLQSDPAQRPANLAAGGALALLFATLALPKLGGRLRLGLGDILLAGLVGLMLGWQIAPLTVAVAALLGLLFRRGEAPIPFGFWLSGATLAAAGLKGVWG